MPLPDLPLPPKDRYHVGRLLELIHQNPEVSVLRHRNGSLTVYAVNPTQWSTIEIGLSITTGELIPKEPDKPSAWKVWITATKNNPHEFVAGKISRSPNSKAIFAIQPREADIPHATQFISDTRSVLMYAVAGVQIFHAYTLVEPLLSEEAKDYFRGIIRDEMISEEEWNQERGYEPKDMTVRRELREIGVTNELSDPFHEDQLGIIRNILGNDVHEIEIV